MRIGDLGIIPRILFATDGAITHILEAYAGEPVDLVRLTSSNIDDRAKRQELGIAEGERALARQSLVGGCETGRVFVHADAVVALDRLPAPVAEELLPSGTSLLRLLAQHRIGTFRETVSDWQGNDERIAASFGLDPSATLVARTYQIVIGGRPVAWVTETFPRDGFSLPGEPAVQGVAGKRTAP